VEAQSAGEVSDEDKSFCDVFNLPLSERPLPGCLVLSWLKISFNLLGDYSDTV